MRKVIRFKTADGKLFKGREAARKHEEVLLELKRLKTLIKATDDTCDFANGNGYYEIEQGKLKIFFDGVAALLEKRHPDLHKAFVTNPRSGFVGRALSDMNSPLYEIYSIVSRIDSTCRLWGQPFFALNPTEGKQVKLG